MKNLKAFLDKQVDQFNDVSFIEKDPISLPRKFTKLEDIEIIGFWIAMLSWGQRVTIINKGNELIEMMDGAPHDFIVNHKESDRKKFESFKHRTFQAIDTLYFLEFLQQFYRNNQSLESAFIPTDKPVNFSIKESLTHFHNQFFSLEHAPQRTRKHVATPVRKSTCKRLNMFLRWMVRIDSRGVDFGLWSSITPAMLHIPLDVHVDKVARKLGLIERKQTDWLTVEELTTKLAILDPSDPVKYDYALFGLGVLSKDIPAFD